VHYCGPMPDNTRPPRALRDSDHRPPLGAAAFMERVTELARAERFESFRVAYKQNAKGEYVVAVIWPGWRRD
jgi:hypothetical protein